MIKTPRDYDAAMARLSALMALDLEPDSVEDNELAVLALVIADFEHKTVTPVKADPIEFILFRADQMQLTRKDLVPYMGSISKVSEVLSRKRPLSLPMIRRLTVGLGIPADILIAPVKAEPVRPRSVRVARQATDRLGARPSRNTTRTPA
jgi:HTH-type transcriptional regulator / antitoxin HigA